MSPTPHLTFPNHRVDRPGDHWPRRTEWHGLVADYYTREDIYARELANVWNQAWLFACCECELVAPGDFITLKVGTAPVLLIRDDKGIHGFHNVCSHRGTLLCEGERGKLGKLIVCPYHQWSYSRDGQLVKCRGMGEATMLARNLTPVSTHVVAGLVFVCLAPEPPDAASLDTTFGSAEPHGFSDAKVAHAIDYQVEANWKTVWENNRECYHCDVVHPQYVKANFDSLEAERANPTSIAQVAAIAQRSESYWESEGLSVKHATGGLARFPDPDDPNKFPISATRTVQAEGYDSESMDGKRVAPYMGRLESPDVGVLRLRSVPSFWCHASCDHAVMTRVLPSSRTQTAIRVTWLVDRQAKEGVDYTLDRLLPFWQLTSEQDWHLCERVAQGLASPAYRPGPLSPDREYNVEAFLAWYEQRLVEHVSIAAPALSQE